MRGLKALIVKAGEQQELAEELKMNVKKGQAVWQSWVVMFGEDGSTMKYHI